MQEHSINTRAPAHTENIPLTELIRFGIKAFSYLGYGLFVWVCLVFFVLVDGLSSPESYNSRFLTLPYLLGGLCLTRSICEAMDGGYDGHAVIFALGLSTLGGLSCI